MASNFATNAPISVPKNGNFNSVADMNGFAWDDNEGLFVPIVENVDTTIPPSPPIGQ